MYPICSMYGIFTYIYPQNCPYVGKYSIHGAYGYVVCVLVVIVGVIVRPMASFSALWVVDTFVGMSDLLRKKHRQNPWRSENCGVASMAMAGGTTIFWPHADPVGCFSFEIGPRTALGSLWARCSSLSLQNESIGTVHGACYRNYIPSSDQKCQLKLHRTSQL